MILPGRDLTWKQFFKRLGEEWRHDAIGEVGASLTFYGILALFPFLIFLVALASYIITPQAEQALLDQLSQIAPSQVTALVADRLHALEQGKHTGILTLSAAGALWSASSGIMALMTGLNRAYDVEETRPFWKTRLIGLAATLVAGAMALIAAFAAVIVPLVAKWMGGPVGAALDWLRLPIAGFLMMLLWALVYRFVPNIKLPFRILTPGSVIGVLIWIAASWGFSQYVRHFGRYEVTYGAVGGVIVTLVWMWVWAQVMLLGAEINKLLAPAEKRAAAGGRLEPEAKPLKPEDRAAGLTPAPRPRPAQHRLGGLAAIALPLTVVLVWRRWIA